MDKALMLGNEAVARGLYEAGVTVVSSYPGTPSTEITEYVTKYNEIYSEWAPNEKEDGDYLLFGYCHIFEWEFGYVLLSEILNTKVNLFGCQLPLERDLYIGENATVRDLAEGY